MGKMIFVSNRLPVTVGKINETLDYTKSIGGLATGLDSYHKKSDSIWIGWPGISDDKINDSDKAIMEEKLKNDYSCLPVFLTEEDIEQFYHGFSNKTIWPLFHYSPDKVSYDINTWKAYKQVNRKFFDIVSQFIEDGDLVWVHDYQLMLLPRMIKDRYPNTKVGFSCIFLFLLTRSSDCSSGGRDLTRTIGLILLVFILMIMLGTFYAVYEDYWVTIMILTKSTIKEQICASRRISNGNRL